MEQNNLLIKDSKTLIEKKETFKPIIQAKKEDIKRKNLPLKEERKLWGKTNHDITITKVIEETTIEKNKTIKERKTEKINLTRQINETAKLVKNDIIYNKLEEIKKAINK